jgi:hypothetical protein
MSTVLASHIMLRLADDRVVLPDTAARRVAAAAILDIGRHYGLLAFRAADTHIHMLAACDRRAAGKLAHAVEVALRLRLRLAVPFAPARIKVVADQHHLHNAFGYVLRQAERHDLPIDPFHEASSLPDLVGLRVVAPDLAFRVSAMLPRSRPRQLAIELGLVPCEDAAPFIPGVDDLDQLSDSAAAAAAMPALVGRRGRAQAVRRAAVALAEESAVGRRGPSALDLAARLGCSARTVTALRSQPLDQTVLRAVRGQLRLRAGWRRAAPAGGGDERRR